MSAFSDHQVGVLRNLLADRVMLKEKIRHLDNRIQEMKAEWLGYCQRLNIVEREIRDLIFGGEREREREREDRP